MPEARSPGAATSGAASQALRGKHLQSAVRIHGPRFERLWPPAPRAGFTVAWASAPVIGAFAVNGADQASPRHQTALRLVAILASAFGGLAHDAFVDMHRRLIQTARQQFHFAGPFEVVHAV